ncbi:HAD-IA family hydrolase [Ectobacillus panaciterrae]|uniref:HAD-IA family hydrolase n=1 Tax=Ectobacillus panaciterrae TaxID=363872 RepID=UPI000406B422|nr:HAD-IA family hydrolase [Ectobacillus panaciterrae]
MIKYIIFDFDGTLVDSKDVTIAAFNQLADKYKYKKMKKEDLESLRKLSIRERCKLLDFPIYKIPFMAAEFYNLYKGSIHHVVLLDGIKDVLEELKSKGYHLAIISSNSENNIREFLQRNHIYHIDEILCSNKIFGKDKVIKKFLKTHKLKNTEVIYVGDEQRDIVACKKSDVKVIWVGWGYDAIEVVEQENPDYIVHTPEEIVQIV